MVSMVSLMGRMIKIVILLPQDEWGSLGGPCGPDEICPLKFHYFQFDEITKNACFMFCNNF